MRRITAAARSLIGRVPSLLKLIPDVLLVVGYFGVAYALRSSVAFSVNLAELWLGLVPFVAFGAVEIASYRRRK